MDVEGRLNAQLGNVILAVGGYSGKLGKDTQGSVTYHTANRFMALAAYKPKTYRAGDEDSSTQN